MRDGTARAPRRVLYGKHLTFSSPGLQSLMRQLGAPGTQCCAAFSFLGPEWVLEKLSERLCVILSTGMILGRAEADLQLFIQ